MNNEIYLDNSATTRCFPEAAELVCRILTEEYGNPSSMHHKGVEAERRITEAKQILADILKVNSKNLYFTSCGTEATSLALFGSAFAKERRDATRILTTDSEHPSVTEAMKRLEKEGFEASEENMKEYFSYMFGTEG